MITSQALWAKLERDDAGRIVGWHSLVDHSADVAAVVEALLFRPTWRCRLAATAGRPDLDDVTVARLAALSFLHDIGKANRGFRARVDPGAELVGHIDQLAWVFSNDALADDIWKRLWEVLGLDRLEAWFAHDLLDLLAVVFAHHGRPWDVIGGCLRYWEPRTGSDPVAELAPMRAGLDRWFPTAFEDGPSLPNAPAFHHAFAGLLMLADWLGSDVDLFPLANGACADRMEFARGWAEQALRAVGLDAAPGRAALQARGVLDFTAAFGRPAPRPVQELVTEPDANLLVVEAETGSGKTEAALWRFASLFQRGLVDGLYFALPTRVAATQIFGRVNDFRDRLFAGSGERPAVVLAVPGQLRVDDAEGRLLPGFKVEWNDGPEDAEAKRLARWAAERPKRYLAAPIAVGTVDQALLAAIQVKHAHLRGTALLRHLLIVDEVHASDRYMEALLAELLRAHVEAGGHALLLSATLGAGMRARLLGAEIPSFAAAAAVPYPAMTWADGGRERQRAVPAAASEAAAGKQVALEPQGIMDEPDAVAALALAAAKEGAKVLVLRNTVGAARRVAEACERFAGLESPLLFRVEGVPTLHHSRFAPEDRRLLDHAVEAQVGRSRPEGGRIVVGTQTLEISLDLDADLLVTDLCPVDVLLQRMGRLHRHAGRARPSGFEAPRAVVLTPRERSLEPLAKRSRHGLGPGVYDDLRIVEATWRLIEAEPVWTIPAMNRRLVEEGTHPERLEAIERELAAGSEAWRRHFNDGEGRLAAELFAAHHAKLDRAKPFDRFRPDPDERLATRLGTRDRHVPFDPAPMGPFGRPITSLRIPHHMLDGVAEGDLPREVVDNAGTLSFRLGAAVFGYGRFGLSRVGP